jgi:hypothetical protein
MTFGPTEEILNLLDDTEKFQKEPRERFLRRQCADLAGRGRNKMRIEGHMKKEGKFWIVEIPVLDVITQGLSKSEAYRIAGTVVEDMVGIGGFKVAVFKVGQTDFVLEANDSSALIPLMLRRQRVKKGITVREASRLMGSKSPNAWGAYEQGRRAPTFDQLERMIRVLNKNSQLVIRIEDERDAA